MLKSGAIGITTVRRLAKDLDLETHLTATYVEVLSAAGLIAPAPPRYGGPGEWLPTQATDTFTSGTESAGWALLAEAWLSTRRDPARVETRDPTGKLRNALSDDLDWRTGPAERHRVLREIALTEPDVCPTPNSIAARLAYQTPLRSTGDVRRVTTGIIAEATELGIVAYDAVSSPTRLLLQDDVPGAATAMETALPEPLDNILVQADMTVIAPGRLLHELFEKHSATPVPQSVTFLIDDVARRYGVLREGSAGAYLHSEDPALITQAVAAANGAAVDLRALAPTVAITSADPSILVEVLRAAGLAPVAKDSSGSLIDVRPRPRRVRATPPSRPHYTEPSPPSAEQISSMVRRTRAGDENTGAAQHAPDVAAVLREAARQRSGVWIGYADAEGGTSTRIVEPVVVSGGTVLAFDWLRQTSRTFTIHRISSARPVESDDADNTP